MKILTAAAAIALLAIAAPAAAHDGDHNPPGWRGGPGTNWENPPGRRGGPGASPDRRWRRVAHAGGVWVWVPQHRCWDRDDNPPGRRGGAGTNWENPPGWRGGPGVSPDRNRCR